MEIPRHWRLKKQRYMLAGVICEKCEVKIFPPRDVCPNCEGDTGRRGVPSTEVPKQGYPVEMGRRNAENMVKG